MGYPIDGELMRWRLQCEVSLSHSSNDEPYENDEDDDDTGYRLAFNNIIRETSFGPLWEY